MIVLLAALALMNAPLELSPKAISTLLILMNAQNVALALTLAHQELSASEPLSTPN